MEETGKSDQAYNFSNSSPSNTYVCFSF